MNRTRRQIEAQMESQRWTCSQASREQSADVLLANAYQRWEELFQAGLYTEARRFWFTNIAGQE